MPNLLTQKLARFVDLSADDRDLLDDLASSRIGVTRSSTLIREGERPEQVFLLIEGWAYRYKMIPDGRRQITACLLPGDLSDPGALLLGPSDDSIGLLSDAVVATISKAKLAKVFEQCSPVGRALTLSAMADAAIVRRWLFNLGQLDAYARIAHLFCELWERAHHVGMTHGNAFQLPLTQEQLGDTVGLTSVHVNRVIKRLRAEGMILLGKGKLVITNICSLRSVAGFDPSYLHLSAGK